MGEDVLKPYKKVLDRWLWPDVVRNQETSVAKAKQAISSYRKAVEDPAGAAELMVYYCELAAGFCNEFGSDGGSYLDALTVMFEQALSVSERLPEEQRAAMLARLEEVCEQCQDFGFGVGVFMNGALAHYDIE